MSVENNESETIDTYKALISVIIVRAHGLVVSICLFIRLAALARGMHAIIYIIRIA